MLYIPTRVLDTNKSIVFSVFTLYLKNIQTVLYRYVNM